MIKEAKFPSLGEIFNPTWAPDGKKIAFSAQVGGYTDLFVYDLDSGQLQRLTDDPFADLEPAWSPDGQSIAFVTDRFGTSLESLSYAQYQLAVMNARGGQITQMPRLSNAKHINPQWSPDGLSVYFLSDPGGITNVYRLSLGDGVITQVTNLFTGVSGITALSPALSVASKASRAVFSVYTGGGYAIQAIEDIHTLAGGPVRELPQAAALLPPVDREVVETGIAAVLNNTGEGLPAEDELDLATAVKAYHPKLSLDFISQPSLAIAADRYGTYIGGGITLFWSDMLGDHNLVTMAQVNGRISDWAALVAYGNRKRRLNWLIGAQWIPYITGRFAVFRDERHAKYRGADPARQANQSRSERDPRVPVEPVAPHRGLPGGQPDFVFPGAPDDDVRSIRQPGARRSHERSAWPGLVDAVLKHPGDRARQFVLRRHRAAHGRALPVRSRPDVRQPAVHYRGGRLSPLRHDQASLHTRGAFHARRPLWPRFRRPPHVSAVHRLPYPRARLRPRAASVRASAAA